MLEPGHLLKVYKYYICNHCCGEKSFVIVIFSDESLALSIRSVISFQEYTECDCVRLSIQILRMVIYRNPTQKDDSRFIRLDPSKLTVNFDITRKLYA